jgi:hypothetical protein
MGPKHFTDLLILVGRSVGTSRGGVLETAKVVEYSADLAYERRFHWILRSVRGT